MINKKRNQMQASYDSLTKSCTAINKRRGIMVDTPTIKMGPGVLTEAAWKFIKCIGTDSVAIFVGDIEKLRELCMVN